MKFLAPARGFPWAWDEAVAAGVAQLWKPQDARLAAVFLVAADALAEAVFRRGVPPVAGPERALSDALDAKVVVEQDAARREQLARQAQQDVPLQVPREQS